MHRYTLHTNVRAECLCCGLLSDFVFSSPFDQEVCKGCARHQGSSPDRMRLALQDHTALWKSELGLAHAARTEDIGKLNRLIAQREQAITALQGELAELQTTLRQGIHEAPSEEVERWFARIEIGEAEQKRDAAYRSRDHAFRALWRADELHHLAQHDAKRCACGRPATACRELGALEEVVESLARWEQGHLERLRAGKPHSLPDDHPEVRRIEPWRRRWHA